MTYQTAHIPAKRQAPQPRSPCGCIQGHEHTCGPASTSTSTSPHLRHTAERPSR